MFASIGDNCLLIWVAYPLISKSLPIKMCLRILASVPITPNYLITESFQ